MGKKRSVIIGSPEEEEAKAKKAEKLTQKKLRTGKSAKVAGMGGGQRVVDTTAESLAEYEEIQKRQAAVEQPSAAPAATAPARRSKTRSKSYAAAKKLIDSNRTYSLDAGLELLRKSSLTRFDPTVELHLILKDKPKSDLRVSLPHAAGKTKKVAVVTPAVLKDIAAGRLDFDALVASPADMPQLVKFAKVLGPRGLMPNPKTGTISDHPDTTAKKLAADTTTILKPDKSGPVIHTTVGKLSLKDSQLEANITALLAAVPGLKKAVLKSTMSPAIKLQV